MLYNIEMDRENTLGRRLAHARKNGLNGKITQLEVANALGVTPQAVSGWERDESMPELDKFAALADFLGTSIQWLMRGPDGLAVTQHYLEEVTEHSKSRGNPPRRPAQPELNEKKASIDGNTTLNVIPAGELTGDTDLPVYSIVHGGSGALVLENEPFTYTARPKRLIGIRDGYGVRVIGNSMAREYSENDIAYIDPRLHPRKGDPCVFQGVREDGTVEAILKYLERSPDASETLYYVSQTNPEKKFTIKKADWQKCHVAVGKESGR